MADLPTGTVTFLFTDIEGSTYIAQLHPDSWEATRERHDAIVRAAVAEREGLVFRVLGDAFCVAFSTASDGLQAALGAQHTLHAEAWGETPIKVRMGLHTGPAEAHDGDYRGYLTLVRVQRVMAAAHGGQILLSGAISELLHTDLPDGVTLRDMGEHRLKGLDQLERIFQVVAPDLPSDFPSVQAVQTLNAIHHNLPIQLTSFVGREKEIAEVKRLLSTTRMLTLTGVGGTGKTRLSLQVAADVLDTFKDGAWLVELAPLADPNLVTQTVTTVLGVREAQGRALLATLGDYLQAKNLLLILDNCEHLLEACAKFADAILHAGPNVRLLASSREALGIAGEQAFHVPSLSVPDPGAVNGGAGLALDHDGQRRLGPEQGLPLQQFEAVRLFLDRACAVKSDFALTNVNASAIAQICFRLDGIPLAIELAAARVKVLRVEQIAARLDDRFHLLTGGSRAAFPRQQTLRATIDWSHSLLTEPERALLRRLSVFAGGWTLEAAEQVTGDGGQGTGDGTQSSSGIRHEDVLDLLTHLVDKSLVVVDDSGEEARYRLLETIRQYAREKLIESGEAERVRDQHLEFFLTLAEEAEPKLYGPEPAKWLKRLDTEHDNLRAAIEWATERGKVEWGLRLVVALSWFWFMRVYYTEGRERTGAMIARAITLEMTPEITLEVAKALNRAADFAQDLGDAEKARSFSEQSLSMATKGVDKDETAHSLYNLARLALAEGDHEKAVAQYNQSIALYREAKDNRGLGGSLQGLAVALTRQGNLEQAVSLFEEVIVLRRAMNDKTLLAFALDQFGRVVQLQRTFERAVALHQESLLLRIRVDNKRGIAFSFLSFASLAAAQKKAERAALLYGAGEALLEALHAKEEFRDPVVHVQADGALRAQLDEAAFRTAWNEGRALTMEQAIEYAMRQE